MSQELSFDKVSVDKQAVDTLEVDQSPGTANVEPLATPVVYRLYKRRWLGIITLVLFNVVCGMNGQFFGPITTNIVNLVYVPVTFLTVHITKKVGIRKTLLLGGVQLLLANWIRVAAISPKLSPDGRYAILMIAQVFIGFAQGSCQIITVRYSELWFDVRTRVVATMLTNISNPLGGAIGSLVLPQAANVKWAILIGAFVATAVFPAGFLIQEHPPTAPTFAGSTKSPGMKSLLRALFGKEPVESSQYMDRRDRIDFALIFMVFGVFCAATTSWSNFANQVFGPYGYTETRGKQIGLFSATILLAGIVAAITGAPVLGRVFGKRLPWAVRIFLPIISACWIAQIWNVKPNNDGAIFATMAIIGICSFLLLPIGLELGAEVTRNAEGSCGLLWLNVNFINFIWILVEDALRAGPDANPPENMTQALIFNGSTIAATAFVFLLGFRGEQKRREMDIDKLKEAYRDDEAHPGQHSAQVPIPSE
ncbi:SubName: Full=Uncharacterized protein {ECO:0000313/EMBL:CCA66805.1} [Serendipita indica DSM 11827]|nr:SubName: Full=Uncharacterized protein {ECO:0000313/EMBL:CCA66805.1} [Serendipita indica DSM 11827]